VLTIALITSATMVQINNGKSLESDFYARLIRCMFKSQNEKSQIFFSTDL
jgi:hypothetical protein